MKSERGGWRPLQRDQLIHERVHDSYKTRGKLAEPTCCPDCGAVYRGGRWTWGSTEPGAAEVLCAACHRIRDDFPAGYVTLRGEFVAGHRDELLALVRNREAAEKREHPLERIMAIAPVEGGLLVTTTDSHLARSIAEAVQAAYKGELDLQYNREDNLLRAVWTR